MASTNKTANYDLSQYIGSDKPTYLGDYNSDMQKIDTAIKGVSDTAGAGASAIGVLQQNVANLTSSVENLENNVPIISENATNALSKANSNENKINNRSKCIKGVMTNDVTLTSNTDVILPIDNAEVNIGGFTFENGGIKIGAGINTILVSANVYFYTGIPGDLISASIMQNNKTRNVTNVRVYSNTNYIHVGVPSVIISVQEGDVIYLYARANGGTPVIKNYWQGTNLNITVIN